MQFKAAQPVALQFLGLETNRIHHMKNTSTETARQTLNNLSGKVIGLCIEIHRELGPGLLESAYEECLAYELSKAGLRFERQRPLPVRYKEVQLDCDYRLDLVVEDALIQLLEKIKHLCDNRPRMPSAACPNRSSPWIKPCRSSETR